MVICQNRGNVVQVKKLNTKFSIIVHTINISYLYNVLIQPLLSVRIGISLIRIRYTLIFEHRHNMYFEVLKLRTTLFFHIFMCILKLIKERCSRNKSMTEYFDIHVLLRPCQNCYITIYNILCRFVLLPLIVMTYCDFNVLKYLHIFLEEIKFVESLFYFTRGRFLSYLLSLFITELHI
ncbi:hypothetical protein AGLY_004853 [Aphis glycines]|uniref:Uncharacterized protein n=1 Tax=Aphis glycines TaxID=307491 RepID=A0A6G0TV74_APHGL|nr:hypothetical protein AGLY_004853 [Aphis glycines]